MKRTATLVAGLLLVTGTVFAAPTVTTTGEVVYTNTVFATDAATLQHPAGDGDTQGLKATVVAQFNEANSLTLTLDEGNDPTVSLEFKSVGKENVFTATTKADDASDPSNLTDANGDDKSLFKTTDLKVVHTKGKVVAQVAGTVTADIYGAMPTGQAHFGADTGADAIYLQYQVTPSVQTTFYPYATGFGVDTIFTDDATGDEVFGLGVDIEGIKDVAGVKLAMTSGAAKGLAVKLGTGAQNTDETTYYVDAEYATTIAGVALKAQAALSTAEADEGKSSRIAASASGKVSVVNYKAELFVANGEADADKTTAIYGEVTAKAAGVDLTAKVANKAIQGADAINAVYLEGKKGFAAINGVAPTVTVSYKDLDLDKDSVASVITAKVDAAIVKDAITVTPSLEISNDGDTSTTAKVQVKYSF